MKAYTYIEKGKFALIDKPKPELQEATDAIVRVTDSRQHLFKRLAYKARECAESGAGHHCRP